MRDINRHTDPYGPAERSIRNIPVTHKRPHTEERRMRPPRRRGRSRLLVLGALFIVVCIVIGALISTVFAGATVHVSPRTATVTAAGTLEAALNAPQGVLPYKMISVTNSATTTVPANGTTQVSRQASGLITVYNAYSTAPQRLIANTRFEAPDGKIYRIQSSVIVPGMIGNTPGSITATVYADSPGDSYNRSGSTTFTIPGFKGDPRYTKFSAISQGAISGGFVGAQPSVAPSDLASAKASLEQGLDSAVRAAAANAIPSGYAAIPGTLTVTFGGITQAPSSGNQALIVESATASGAVVYLPDLASSIAHKTVNNYNGEAIALDPGSALTLTATSSNVTKGMLTITLGGTATLIWQFDPNAIKQALLGKPKAQFQTVLQSFTPAISCTSDSPCDASIRPFWLSKFPSDPNKITVLTPPSH